MNCKHYRLSSPSTPARPDVPGKQLPTKKRSTTRTAPQAQTHLRRIRAGVGLQTRSHCPPSPAESGTEYPKSAHGHKEPLTSPCPRATNRPTMTLSEMDSSKRQLGAGDLRHRAHLAPVKKYQGTTAGLGGPWSDPGCSSHQDRSPIGDAAGEWARRLGELVLPPSRGRCLSADRFPAAQPWGRGANGAGATASPAARARSAAPGRPRLQPEPDSQRRRHLRLLQREGEGPRARKPGPQGVASWAKLGPM